MPSEITNSTLAAQIQSLIQSWQTREKQLQTWLGGTVGGGDSSNGTYPLSDYLGNTQYVECPAQLADDVTNTVSSATTQATAASASATAAAASATAAAVSSTLSGTYATNAATSATQASNYSNAAGTYQAAALANENASASSASDADSSATDADTSASDAATSATAAASSATDAASSATAAATSATAAAASATAAAASAPLPSLTGNSGKYLTTDGSTASWADLTIPSAAGSNTQIQFNDSGAFGADAHLLWNGTTLTVIPSVGGAATGIYCDGGDITAARSDVEGIYFLGENGTYSLASAPVHSVSYGSVVASGATNGYSGFVVNEGSQYPTLMGNGSNCGIYLQGGVGWLFYASTSLITSPNLPWLFQPPSGKYAITLQGGASGSNLLQASFLNSGGSSVGSITSSGSTTTFSTTSDRRLKKGIEDADIDSAGLLIDQLQVRRFNWRTDDKHVEYGLVAQELHEVFPEAVVVGDEERPWQIDPSKLVPLLVAEVQSLRTRVQHLESNVTSL